MTWENFTMERALEAASICWWLLMLVWLVMAFSMKRAKKRETPGERAQHLIPVLLGFWLLFGRKPHWGWLNLQVLPQEPSLWMVGLMLTAVGVGIGIWARLSLGTNWSGMVTLKSGHELIRHGLYRWIRHPIYTGILGGMVGTAIIIGDLRGFLGVVIVLASFYCKARREERFLKQEFGAGFEEHARQTGMFLPRLG
jgi:protein-S-isoprenylcysteine O-methyltransferase Ste14